MFEREEGMDDHEWSFFSSLDKDIKWEELSTLLPAVRIIQAAEVVCSMPDDAFAVRLLQRKNVYKPRKMRYELNLDGLNDSQADAVQKFIHMESGVMTIHGPPGKFWFVISVALTSATITIIKPNSNFRNRKNNSYHENGQRTKEAARLWEHRTARIGRRESGRNCQK